MNEEETAVKKDKKAQDFIWTLVCILIIVLIEFGLRDGGWFRSKEAEIPDVRGMSYDDAVTTIKAKLKKAGIENVEFHQGWGDAGPKYELLVASQDPEPGTVVHKGDKVVVNLLVGEGWYSTQYPIKYEIAEDILQYFTSMPQSAVCGTTVEIRTKVLTDADIHVYVGAYEAKKTHDGSDYWGYSFPMPVGGATVTAKWYTEDELKK